MKTLTGCFAILLGGVGTLIALVVTGLVWWGAFKITAQTEKATSHADKALVQVEEGLSTLKEPVASTTKSVEEVREAAATAGERPNTPAAKAEADRLRTTLLPLIERTEMMSTALPPIAELLDNAADLAGNSGNEPRADRLRVTAGSVREAAKELDDLRDHAAEFRVSKEAMSAKEVESLARRTRKPLDRMTTALSDVKQESERLRGELPEVRRTFNSWVYTGAAVLTGILFCIGLGQLAIISWGRRRFASPAVVPPQTTTLAR